MIFYDLEIDANLPRVNSHKVILSYEYNPYNILDQPPPPQKACAWVGANGAVANNNASAASTVVLKVIVVFVFINILEKCIVIDILNN